MAFHKLRFRRGGRRSDHVPCLAEITAGKRNRNCPESFLERTSHFGALSVGASTTMNIPKIVAELRLELELVEASIHAFEPLVNKDQSGESFTEVAVRHPRRGSGHKLNRRNGSEVTRAFGAV
jgi:hypothetical protein